MKRHTKMTQASDCIRFAMTVVITFLLASVSVRASAIDEYQLHSGTAVLKGRILNKPADEWNIVSVRAYDLFTGEEISPGFSLMSDGVFGWRSDLIYHIEHYNIDLPKDFILHVDLKGKNQI